MERANAPGIPTGNVVATARGRLRHGLRRETPTGYSNRRCNMMRKLRITSGAGGYTVWENDNGVVWDTPTPGPKEHPSDWRSTAGGGWRFRGHPAPTAIVTVLEDEVTLHLGGEWRLTTGHPASNAGIPVLIDGRGAPYGPRDLVEFSGKVMPARTVVKRLSKQNGIAGAPMVLAFLAG